MTTKTYPQTRGYRSIDLDDVDLLGERDCWIWHKQNWDAGALDGLDTGAYIDFRLAEIEGEIERRRRFRLSKPDGTRRYSRQFLDDLRGRTDLVALIQGHGGVLRRVTPGHWRGPCAWCEGGRNDTLSVNSEKNLWHCFRCNLGGDAIAWHTLMSGLPFEQVVEGLAAIAGVDVPPPPRIGPAPQPPRRPVLFVEGGAHDR